MEFLNQLKENFKKNWLFYGAVFCLSLGLYIFTLGGFIVGFSLLGLSFSLFYFSLLE